MKYLILVLCFLLTACEIDFGSSKKWYDKPVQVSYINLSQVKWIHNGIENPRYEDSYLMYEYSITQNSHLLMNSESLNEKLRESSDSLKSDYWLSITSLIPIEQMDLDNIKICPVLSSWLMLATWERAHPFKGGAWDTDGGDFIPNECVLAMFEENIERERTIARNNAKLEDNPDAVLERVPEEVTNSTNLVFPINNWVKQKVLAGAQVNGLLLKTSLLNDFELNIYGDKSSQAPVLRWDNIR